MLPPWPPHRPAWPWSSSSLSYSLSSWLWGCSSSSAAGRWSSKAKAAECVVQDPAQVGGVDVADVYIICCATVIMATACSFIPTRLLATRSAVCEIFFTLLTTHNSSTDSLYNELSIWVAANRLMLVVCSHMIKYKYNWWWNQCKKNESNRSQNDELKQEREGWEHEREEHKCGRLRPPFRSKKRVLTQITQFVDLSLTRNPKERGN